MFITPLITAAIAFVLHLFGINLTPAQIAGMWALVWGIKAALIFGIYWAATKFMPGGKKAPALPAAEPPAQSQAEPEA